MSYSTTVGVVGVFSDEALHTKKLGCGDAYKCCMPPFVFSAAGQEGFRHALLHFIECNKRECMLLRKEVRECAHAKLRWLFDDGIMLGCAGCQEVLYRERSVCDLRRNQHFITVAHHLTYCANEECAKLRRSLLLTIRDQVSPSAKSKRLKA